MWLIVEPAIWLDRIGEDESSQVARDFARERLAGRYNRQWNSILDAWSHLFKGNADSAELRAFGVDDGVDAVFKIGRVTGFSAKGGG